MDQTFSTQPLTPLDDIVPCLLKDFSSTFIFQMNAFLW